MQHLGNSYEPRVPRFLDDSWLENLDKCSKTPKSLTHASNWTDSNHAKQQDYGDEDPWYPLGGFFETLVPEFHRKEKRLEPEITSPRKEKEKHFEGCTFEWY